jgi:hypothetical protein
MTSIYYKIQQFSIPVTFFLVFPVSNWDAIGIDWNDGMLGYWNVGFGRLGKLGKWGIDK